MSKLITTTPKEGPGDVDKPPFDNERVCQPLVAITTRQVALATAAAVGRPRNSLSQRFVAAFLRSADTAPPIPRHYPPRRSEFLEDATMQQEMHRL